MTVLQVSLTNYAFSVILIARLVARMPIQRICRHTLSFAQCPPDHRGGGGRREGMSLVFNTILSDEEDREGACNVNGTSCTCFKTLRRRLKTSSAEGKNFAEVLNDLFEHFPALRKQIQPDGNLSRFLISMSMIKMCVICRAWIRC